MAQEYLPAPSNIRLADLMKEHNISQPELAKEIGCSKSTISRFISGAKGTLTHEQVLKIARLFNVSTDFLLGETNIPDRKNYDIAELGLSVEAAKNLYTGRVNTEVVNLLLENARFAELTYRIAQYFDDTFASGIAAQNAMLTTLSTLLRTRVKTPEAAKAAKDISLRRKPVYQGDLDDIEMYFMAAVKEIKKGIGSHYAEQEAMSKKVAEKMFTELTKGQDVQHPTITAEQLIYIISLVSLKPSSLQRVLTELQWNGMWFFSLAFFAVIFMEMLSDFLLVTDRCTAWKALNGNVSEAEFHNLQQIVLCENQKVSIEKKLASTILLVLMICATAAFVWFTFLV